MRPLRFLGFLIVGAALGACSSTPDLDDILPDETVAYKKQKTVDENLEVPPDLTRGGIQDSLVVPDVGGTGSTTYSEYQDQRSRQRGSVVTGGEVLPKVKNISVKRDGNDRWLEIEESPERVWPQVVAFWREQGIVLVEQDPAVGVMKTDWLENRADIKRDIITRTLSKVASGLYSAATRDQYRVRLEPGRQPGTTDLYLTHRGMQEKLTRDVAGETQGTFWEPRPTDPGLEAEMLRRMMVYLGASDKQAKETLAEKGPSASRSELVKQRDGTSMLVLQEDFPRAWRLVGVALDRVGFAVEDRDRSKGVYYVRYDDPYKQEEKKEGVLSKLKFWGDDKVDKANRYQVKLASEGNRTDVTILNDGGVLENSPTATRILTLLEENLR